MIANLLVIALVIGIAALWGSRGKGYGLFSSFLAAVCTIVAGGIALAVWEPLAYGVLMNFRDDLAFTLALIGPFAIALVLLRLLTDFTVKANLDFDEVTNFVGGAAFGLVSGIVSVGILVLGVSMLPIGPSLMGWKAVEDDRGNLIYSTKLWLPVDVITTRLYEHLSMGGFGSPDPLAVHRPNLHIQTALNRMTFDGKTRSTIDPDAFTINGRYVIEGSLEQLKSDMFSGQAQSIRYPSGDEPREGAVLQGYIVTFSTDAKEKKTGQFVIGPGQVRLVCYNSKTKDAVGIHPFAMIAQNDPAAGGLYRFRMNADDLHMGSVGGGSNVVMGFEFLVPPGYAAKDLIIKTARKAINNTKLNQSQVAFRSYEDRDEAILRNSIFADLGITGGAGGGAPLDDANAITLSQGAQNSYAGISVTSRLPGSYIIPYSARGSIEVNEQGEKLYISGGSGSYEREVVTNRENRALQSNVRIDAFLSTRTTGIVQLTIVDKSNFTAFGQKLEASDRSKRVTLVDQFGNRYLPIGFVSDDGKVVQVTFGNDIQSISELPAISRSKRDQTLYVIFRPTSGVRITGLAIGDELAVKLQGDGIEVK